MAYSRWGTSTWYTFWAASSEDSSLKWPTESLKRSQCFQICDMPSYTFTYGELKDKGINKLLGDIWIFYRQDHKGQIIKEFSLDKIEYEEAVYPAKNPSENELLELVGYICRWEKDVDEHFRFWKFAEYEWFYPIRNQILWKSQSIRAKLAKWVGKNNKENEE